MAKNSLVITLRIISVVLLGLLIVQVASVYGSDAMKIWEAASIIGDLRDVFAYILYILLFLIFFVLMLVFGFIVGIFGIQQDFGSDVSTIFTNLVGRWFYFPVERNVDSAAFSPIFNKWFSGFIEALSLADTSEGSLEAPGLNEALGGLIYEVNSMTSDIFLVLLQLLIMILIFFAIRASLTSNPADSIKVVTIINILIIIPLFVIQIYEVFTVDIYLLTYENWPEFYQEMLVISTGLIKEPLLANILDMGILEFLGSKLFLIALSVFIYLEFVFQLAYVQKVTTPTLERESRLSRQIEVMHHEATKVIDRIKQVEEKKRETRQKEREDRMLLSEGEREKLKEQEDKLSLSSFMSEKGESTGFSYVADLIKKKKEEKKEQKLLDAMKDTRKVANYLDKLFKNDPKAKAQLTAKTAAPKATKLVKATIINMLTRIILITALSWLCVHPKFVFQEILRSPLAISQSVELITYEAVLSLLFPILLMIPLISTIIKITKHNKLQEILRLEEIRRLGITEAEYEALLIEREEDEQKKKEEGVGMARDKDAIANETKKAQRMAQYQ